MTLPSEGGLLLSYLLVIPKGATNVAATRRLLNAVIQPDYQLRLAEGGSWPMNPDTQLTPQIKAELGGKLQDIMRRNYALDWMVVGNNLRARTRQVEELME